MRMNTKKLPNEINSTITNIYTRKDESITFSKLEENLIETVAGQEAQHGNIQQGPDPTPTMSII